LAEELMTQTGMGTHCSAEAHRIIEKPLRATAGQSKSEHCSALLQRNDLRVSAAAPYTVI
jgi:hypothetical protein